MNRIWAIPDIHGRLDLLDSLLLKLHGDYAFGKGEDKLVFLGDMIDRGDDSRGVLDRVMVLKEYWGESCVVLGGNHEWLMINGCRGAYEDFDLWMYNGGDATLRSFPAGKVPDKYLDWCAALPLYHEEPGFFFSHAPIPNWAQRRSSTHEEGLPFSKDMLIWTYQGGDEGLWSKRHDGDVVGVCGHIHRLRQGVKEPRLYPHYIFADAGCGCSESAPLVAVDVRSREVVHAWPT